MRLKKCFCGHAAKSHSQGAAPPGGIPAGMCTERDPRVERTPAFYVKCPCDAYVSTDDGPATQAEWLARNAWVQPEAKGPRHWTVKFMRLGQEPPHPFGKTTAVVCAETRDDAKSQVSGMANDYWPVTASATDKPPTYPFSCHCQ